MRGVIIALAIAAAVVIGTGWLIDRHRRRKDAAELRARIRRAHAADSQWEADLGRLRRGELRSVRVSPHVPPRPRPAVPSSRPSSGGSESPYWAGPIDGGSSSSSDSSPSGSDGGGCGGGGE